MQNSADTHAHPAQIRTGSTGRTGLFTCILIIACISASYLALFGLEWERNQPLHTDLEGVATVMALIVGLMAIVNYYSQRQGLTFLPGVAFLGTATLDGYHAIVTSAYFKEYMPSDLPSLIPWNWIASRWFLSVFLFAMAIVWRLDPGTKITSPRGAITLYAIKVAGIAPHKLELEITESMAMAHQGNIIDLLNNLKELGVGLAIDDFGTGYSSLSRLKDFPVDRLKINRSFIIDMTIDNDHHAISAAIVRLGHALGLKVIAEGVETAAHLDILKGLECDEAQGYLFARPLLEDDLIGFMQTRDTGSAAA